MEEKNQLSDIILDKNNSTGNSKKIILAVATLGIILIIVVVLMNSLTSNGTSNLPQAQLPKPLSVPQEQSKSEYSSEYDEPLFEEVEVIEDIGEDLKDNENLAQIAKKLKKESLANDVEMIEDPIQREVKKVKHITHTKKVTPVKKAVHHVSAPKVKREPKHTVKPKVASSGHYYIQVGSFSIYKPNKKFLHSITSKGYNYIFHKVNKNGKTINKILIGPFKTEKEVRNALKSVRKNIVAGAFLTKI
jgi:DedD protein